MALSTVGTMSSVDGDTIDNKLWKKLPIGNNREDQNLRYVNEYHQPLNKQANKTKQKKTKTQLHCDRERQEQLHYRKPPMA